MSNLAVEWINTALLCERLHILPEAGGLLDQSSNTIECLQLTFEEIDNYRKVKSDQETKKSASKR